METLTLYHGTPYKYEKPEWDQLDGECGGNMYGEGMYFSLRKEDAIVWGGKGGNLDTYQLNTEGLKVLNVKEHGREMYETIISMINGVCDYDVVILPNDLIGGYGEDLFFSIIMGDGTEEEIQFMCDIAKKGESDFKDENGCTYKFDLSNPIYEVVVRNEETLNKLVRVNRDII